MTGKSVSPGSIEELLREMGAPGFPHENGRSLYEHLMATRQILKCWSQPEWICDAGALHSIYGTDVYREQLVPLALRSEVRAVVGPEAERLVYLFGAVSRRDLFLQMDCRSVLPGADSYLECQTAEPGGCERLTDGEAAALLILHMANFAEQNCAAGGSPALYLADLSRLALIVGPTASQTPPVFDSCRQEFSAEDEAAARDAYLAGLGAISKDRRTAMDRMAEAVQKCPWVAEPPVWLAYLNLQEGRHDETRFWIERAKMISAQWGTAWDKRLTFDQWSSLTDFVAQQVAEPEIGPLPAPDDAQDLPRFLQQLETRNWIEVFLGAGLDTPAEEHGVRRFHRYIESFADNESGAGMAVYPALDAPAWSDPANFPLARALEAEYDVIRGEILALDDRQFTTEAEPIQRSGNWTVLFFSERGRRNEEVCARCPVTTRVLEAHGAVSTLSGLSYVSRLAPGSHVRPHCGPTNLRLRCHLGIRVPQGNCGIRVAGETRQWQEGKCLVFNDFLQHEAWNHSAGERLVLIVDLWHPDLTAREIALLTGLQRYAAAQAVSLNAYWAANDKARAAIDDRGNS